MKKQKGITLIALIITIIVLLILAVVTINSIKDDGIIAHADNAATKYNKVKGEEESYLQNYITYLEEKTNPKKEIEFTIDGTKCKALEGMSWETWILSEYNTIGVYIHNGEYTCIAFEYEPLIPQNTSVDYMDPAATENIKEGDVFVKAGTLFPE